MKKFLVLAIALMMLVSVSAVSAAEADLRLSGEIPDGAVQPGDSFTLRLVFDNIGTTGATSIDYEIIAGSAISGYSTGHSEIGGVPAGESRIVKVPLTVASDASTGAHPLTVKVRYGGGSNSPLQEEFTVQVGNRADLYLQNIWLEPEVFEPGSDVTLYASFKNVGEDAARKVSAVIVANSTDIKPVLSGGEAYVDIIGKGSTKALPFTIAAESGTSTGMYDATITVNYEDSTGVSASEEFDIGIPVSGTPSLEILNTKIETGEYKIEVQNLGTSKAKAIKVTLRQDGQIVGVDIENEIKADKKSTFRFTAYTAGVGEVTMEYLDEENREYSETIPVSISGSASGGSGASGIIFFLIAVVEGIYIYKLRKKLKKQNKQEKQQKK
ncbi:MAG: CARDB domain-containing protein [archaeon]